MNFDWQMLLVYFYHLVIAYLLALPIGWERERKTQSAGLRTFPLVAVGACGYMLLGIHMLEGAEAQSRVMYGVITGMGFIGGGAILKKEAGGTGTATAASLWNTGALGLAVAWDRYEIAIILSLFNFITLRYATHMKTNSHEDDNNVDQLK